MDQTSADAYATQATNKLADAVAAGDANAANAVVDQVAADGHHDFATVLNTALAHTSLADQLTIAERYALWLTDTGIENTAANDLNEGLDPITAAGGEVTDVDARAGRLRALDIARWIRDNPRDILALAAGEAEVTHPDWAQGGQA